jgi:hypothetical protein
VEGGGRFLYVLEGIGGFHLWAADLETGELIQERFCCGHSRLTCKSINADIGISKSIQILESSPPYQIPRPSERTRCWNAHGVGTHTVFIRNDT